MTAPTREATRAAVQRALHPEQRSYAYRASFPARESLGLAYAMYERIDQWSGTEGPRPRVEFSPGTVAVTWPNLARRERTLNRKADDDRKRASELARELEREGHFLPDPLPRSEITDWSRKSRLNMFRTLSELDYSVMFRSGRPPAMITLTVPDRWEALAPDGKTFKRAMNMFWRSYERAWGEPLCGVWKLEFQRRGAPHLHILMCPPRGRARKGRRIGRQFRSWLSYTWADAINERDLDERAKHVARGTGIDFAEGMKASDPRRVATYFLKHGAARAKEYQHIVPELWQAPGAGPGRFWGYRSLERLRLGVEVHPEDAIYAGRIMRRWSRAQRITRLVDAPRTPGGRLVPVEHEVIGLAGAQAVQARSRTRLRGIRRRAVRLAKGRGWIMVNDGASYAVQLSRAIELGRSEDPPGDRRPPGAGGAAPGMCRACGQSRRTHRCPAWEASKIAQLVQSLRSLPADIDTVHDRRPNMGHITSPRKIKNQNRV